MTIHWTDARKNGARKIGARNYGEKPTRSLSRRTTLSGLSIICTVWMCVASANTVHAQSGSEGLQQADGMIQHGDQSYRVVSDASYRTAADVASTQPSDIEQVGFHGQASGGCSTCGTSSCGGSCGSVSMPTASCGTCGTVCGGTGGRCGLGLGSICSSNRVSGLSCRGALSNDPCAPCQPYRYASVEALYMQRDDVSYNRNGTLPLPDFDYEFGPRIVIGAVYDCVNGYEASLVGPFNWDASNRLAAPVNTSVTFATGPGRHSVGGFGTLMDVTTTTTVSGQSQSLDSRYFSIDSSKTINGWEIAKLSFGPRYVNFEEDYSYAGTTTTVEERDPVAGGLADESTTTTTNIDLSSDIENHLVGMQVGLDLLYPIGRFAFSDMRMRAGAYANFAESNYQQAGTQTIVSNPAFFSDRTQPLASSGGDSDVELAGLFEFGTGIRYQVGEILSLRAGVEVWYLANVASATDNVSRPNGPISIDEDVLFTGLSFGSELRW